VQLRDQSARQFVLFASACLSLLMLFVPATAQVMRAQSQG
jgi:hypothetical protein